MKRRIEPEKPALRHQAKGMIRDMGKMFPMSLGKVCDDLLSNPNVLADAEGKANESECPSCQFSYHEPPGTPIMCVKCGDWMVTESVPE